MNANRRNWFCCECCLVLNYCARRIWIAIDENGWQITKLYDNVSKLIDQRRNWNEHSHIPECPGRKWKHIFQREWKGDENGRENLYRFLYTIVMNISAFIRFMDYWQELIVFNINRYIILQHNLSITNRENVFRRDQPLPLSTNQKEKSGKQKGKREGKGEKQGEERKKNKRKHV